MWQRTGNAGVMNDALAKRTDLVRAFIDERVHPAISGTENRDRFASLYRQRTRAKSWQLVNRSNIKRSEEHTSELQSLMRRSSAVFCLKKNNYRQKSMNEQAEKINTII